MTAAVLPANDPRAVDAAIEAIARGGLVIMPTETVYGLAIDPGSPAALTRLYELKQRDRGKPLTRFIADPGLVARFDPLLRAPAARCAARCMPGPLTMVIEDSRGAFTGVRMPAHPVARAVTAGLPCLCAVTSVNRSGEPPLARIADIKAAFGPSVDLIIDDGDLAGTPSTVAEFGRRGIRILREGDMSLDAVRDAATVTILFVCSGNICRSAAAEYYLRQALRLRLGPADLEACGYRVRSAGTLGLVGNGPPEEVVRIMAKEGIDLRDHLSTALSAQIVAGADRIFVMDEGHMIHMRAAYPAVIGRTRLLRADGRDIEDPYEGPARLYERVMSEIRQSVMEVASGI
ncbi:MAG: Sua5/YciO/YrdC/YwlC family protein [Planctomycetota bacterium]